MEFHITFKTPGHYLSTTTLSSVMSDISSIIENSIIEGIRESEPKISKSNLKKLIRSQLHIYLSEVKKGSWNIELLAAIGVILAQLALDVFVNNKDYGKVRDYINTILSKNIFAFTKKNIEKRQKLASLKISEKRVEYSVTDKGIVKTSIYMELVIEQEKVDSIDLDSNSQIEMAIENDKEKRHKKIIEH